MTPTQPDDTFTTIIVALLVPMFLAAAGGDLALARAAAIHTVNAYRPQTGPDILAVTQIVAFGLATLDSLSRSMEDDLPLTLALRLRSSAVSSNRAAASTGRALTARSPQPQKPHIPAKATAQPAPMRHHPAAAPAETPAEAEQRRTIWANAMTQVAAEFAADLADLTPSQQRAATTRIAALQNTAAGLRAGQNGQFPTHLDAPPA